VVLDQSPLLELRDVGAVICARPLPGPSRSPSTLLRYSLRILLRKTPGLTATRDRGMWLSSKGNALLCSKNRTVPYRLLRGVGRGPRGL
jgi:hypothetical protein